jgi:carboxylesterase
MPSILVLHGFTSHPVLTMGPLPQVLREAGYTVSNPALPGHGTKPEDLKGVKWQDWYRVALEAYRALPEPRGIASLSVGALIGAKIAAEEGTTALVAMAPAFGFSDPLASLAPYVHWLVPRGKGTQSVRDPERKRNSPNYPYFPTTAFVEVLKLRNQIPELLPKVQAPALVVQAAHDSTIPEKAVRQYYGLLGSKSKQYQVFTESEHDLLLDAQADEAAAFVRDWLIGHLPPDKQ